MAHILLIDDDDQFRDMMTQMLQQDQHKLTVAKDGAEGLALINSTRFDLIITDILMPKMDGIELIAALKKLACKTPIIALSGGRRMISADFNLESASLVGVSSTLAKPFTRNELRDAIKEALA